MILIKKDEFIYRFMTGQVESVRKVFSEMVPFKEGCDSVKSRWVGDSYNSDASPLPSQYNKHSIIDTFFHQQEEEAEHYQGCSVGKNQSSH